jgi:TetR/AcrR family transcriptional repressor of bet genes
MPVQVDHEARKRLVISATIELIAERGLEDTSIRTVSARAGYSTSIVTHYFRDKTDLLKSTYLAVADGRRTRLGTCIEIDKALPAAALSLLPLDDKRQREWKVYCAFLASGIGHGELASIQSEWSDKTIGLFASLLAGTKHPSPAQARSAASRLVSFLTGLSVMHLINPTGFSREKISALTLEELASL